jgi:hypothetical protein
MRRTALAALSALMLAGQCLAGDTVLQSISGNGTRTTRPFHVPDGWELQWESQGDIFQVYVLNQAGDIIGLAASQFVAGKGSSYVEKGGTVHLRINAGGAWTLRVVRVEADPAPSK